MGNIGQGSGRRRAWRGLQIGAFVAMLLLLVAVPVALALSSGTSYPFASSPTTDWKNSNQTVSVVVETSATALATLHYSIDGGVTFSTSTATHLGTDTIDVPITSEGSHLFRYYASATGTNTVEATSTGNTYVNIDKTAPVTTATPALAAGLDLSPWFDSAVTVTLIATDPLSGVLPAAGTSYRVAEGNLTIYSAPFQVSTEGSTKLTYRSVDRAGNIEATQTAYVNIDSSIPTVSATSVPSHSSGWYNKDVVVTLAGADSVSGVAKTQYRIKTDPLPTWTTAVGNQFGVLASANAKLVYDYQAVDKAGNGSAIGTLSLNMDNIVPKTYGTNASGKVHKSITLKYKITDNLSPKAKSVAVKIKDSKGHVVKNLSFSAQKNVKTWYSFTWKPAKKGTYKYYVYAKDLAGNPQKPAGHATITVK